MLSGLPPRLCAHLTYSIQRSIVIQYSSSARSQGLTQELVEQLKGDDVLSGLLAQLRAQYPQLLAPLLHERDAYLAWSLKRSKAVNGTQRYACFASRKCCTDVP